MRVAIPAWVHDRYVSLPQILHRIGDNTWTWRIEEFHGISHPGSGLDVLDLEERLSRGETVDVGWPELRRFADQVHQMIDGRLAARTSPEDAEAVLTIEAFDSSEWVVEARGDDEAARAAAARLATLAA